MLQPYTESVTTLSDYYTDDEEIARISGFCGVAEMDFHHSRNVSVDLKYDVMCL